MEFTETLAQVAELLQREGKNALAAAVLRADAQMVRAYQGGRGADGVRSHVRTILTEVASDPAAEAVRSDLRYAIGWIEKAEEIDQEVSATRHLRRRPSRDTPRP
jgi:hypothetical protein